MTLYSLSHTNKSLEKPFPSFQKKELALSDSSHQETKCAEYIQKILKSIRSGSLGEIEKLNLENLINEFNLPEKTNWERLRTSERLIARAQMAGIRQQIVSAVEEQLTSPNIVTVTNGCSHKNCNKLEIFDLIGMDKKSAMEEVGRFYNLTPRQIYNLRRSVIISRTWEKVMRLRQEEFKDFQRINGRRKARTFSSEQWFLAMKAAEKNRKKQQEKLERQANTTEKYSIVNNFGIEKKGVPQSKLVEVVATIQKENAKKGKESFNSPAKKTQQREPEKSITKDNPQTLPENLWSKLKSLLYRLKNFFGDMPGLRISPLPPSGPINY